MNVFFPENDAEKAAKTSSQSAVQTIAGKRDRKTAGAEKQRAGGDFLKARSNFHPVKNDPHVTVTKEDIDGLHFERAHPGDKRLGRLVSVARSRTFREHQNKILLEGRRLICDALEAGALPQTVFFSTVDRLKELPLHKLRRASLIKVKFEDIKTWSDVVAPQGVIAIFTRPDPSRLNFGSRNHSVPLSLICDNIRDPGNLGTMLRCAAAAGCHNVLLSKGCVDVWEPKVLRAAMGAHFRLPIFQSLAWNDIETHLPKSVTVHVADSSCGSEISGETNHPHIDAPHKSSKAGDYGWISSHREQGNLDSDSDSECEGLQLPVVDSRVYHEGWASGPTALVVGGETHGLSVESVQLAEKTAGSRLFIPVVPHMDSLNSAMAASILLFEGRKQLLKLLQMPGRSRAERRRS